MVAEGGKINLISQRAAETGRELGLNITLPSVITSHWSRLSCPGGNLLKLGQLAAKVQTYRV